MPTIIAQSERERIPKSLSYPIKYKDIKRALQGFDANEICLRVYFRRQHAMWKKDRERAKRDGHFSLLTLTIAREPSPDSYVDCICGGLGESNPMETGAVAHVNAIESTDMREVCLSQECVAEALYVQVRHAEDEGRVTGECEIEATLDVGLRRLLFTRVYRRGHVVERQEQAVYKPIQY